MEIPPVNTDSAPKADAGKHVPPPPAVPLISPWQEKWRHFVDTVDWEQFTGTKLLSWIGVFALFIAAVFFVKYSIDNNLVPVKLRLALSAVIGLCLLIGAGRFKTSKYNIMRHILAACGIGVLYSVVFAAVLYYQFIPKPLGFGLLVLISAAAFVLAVFYKSKAAAVLGALGAFSTPILVSTGGGSLIMLFLYLAIVNIGLFLVVRSLKSGGLLLVACLGSLMVLNLASFFAPTPQPGLTIALVCLANLVLFCLFLDLSGMPPDRFASISSSGVFLYFAITGTALALLLRETGWSPLFSKKLLPIGSVTVTGLITGKDYAETFIEPGEATLGAVEKLEGSAIGEIIGRVFGGEGWGLYIVFGLVTLFLIILIVRLFPKIDKKEH